MTGSAFIPDATTMKGARMEVVVLCIAQNSSVSGHRAHILTETGFNIEVDRIALQVSDHLCPRHVTRIVLVKAPQRKRGKAVDRM